MGAAPQPRQCPPACKHPSPAEHPAAHTLHQNGFSVSLRSATSRMCWGHRHSQSPAPLRHFHLEKNPESQNLWEAMSLLGYQHCSQLGLFSSLPQMRRSAVKAELPPALLYHWAGGYGFSKTLLLRLCHCLKDKMNKEGGNCSRMWNCVHEKLKKAQHCPRLLCCTTRQEWDHEVTQLSESSTNWPVWDMERQRTGKVTFLLFIAYFYIWKTINSSLSLVFSE